MTTSPLQILIVEDEPGHAEAIRRAFKTARSMDQVQVAPTLQSCSEILDTHIPDIVITDIQLPDGRAFEVLAAPAEQRKFPVVVMTSYGNEQVAVDAIKAGAIDYVVKSPETLRDMPRTVERVMREWNLQQQARAVQDKLNSKQEELSAIYDGTPVMMCVVGSGGRIISSNRAFEAVRQEASPDCPSEGVGCCLGCINAFDDPQGCGYGPRCQICALRAAVSESLQSATSCNDLEVELVLRGQAVERHFVFLASITPMPPVDGSPCSLVSLLDITARKHSEAAIKKSEARFRSYFDMPLSGIAITSVEKKWVEVNDKLASIMGYSRDEILRMTWEEMTHPDDLALDIEQFDRIFSGEIEQYSIEKRFIRKDGNIIWTHLGVGCVRKSDKSLDYIVAVISDITERRKAEDNIRFMAEGHKIAAELSAAFIKAITIDDFNEAVNVTLQRLGNFFGADHSYLFKFDDDCAHMSNTNEWCAPGVESCLSGMQNQATNTLPWWKERMVKHMPLQINDVSELPPEAAAEKKEFMAQGICSLLSVPTIGDQGQLSGFIGFELRKRIEHWSENKVSILQVIAGIIGSVYQRLNALESLRLSESKVTSILNAIDAVVISISLNDNKLYYVSPSYQQIFGKEFDQDVNILHPWMDMIHPDDCEKFYAEFAPSIEAGSYVGELRIVLDNGEIRWLLAHFKVISDEQGVPFRLDSYISDVTERMQAEESVEKHLEELEQWYHVTLNREGRVLEMKDEVNKLLERLGEAPKYAKQD